VPPLGLDERGLEERESAERRLRLAGDEEGWEAAAREDTDECDESELGGVCSREDEVSACTDCDRERTFCGSELLFLDEERLMILRRLRFRSPILALSAWSRRASSFSLASHLARAILSSAVAL
jgi:hypothetical protein